MSRALRQFSVAAVLLQMVAVLILVPGVQSVAASQTAQEETEGGVWSLGITANTGPGAHFVVTNEAGDYIGECTLEEFDPPVPWANCRVDVPSDRVSLVWEDLDSIPGYAPRVNPIAFDPTTYETGPHNIGANFENVPVDGSADSGTSSTVAQQSGGGAKDISLITRDPDSGDLLTDVCYVLAGYSNVGCDENGDGQVTFAAIPVGTYTVEQTSAPAGYSTVRDFSITVDDQFPAVPVGYVVKQARQQNASGERNVSFIFVDSRTYTKIVPSPICVKIGTVSNVGCDEDLVDGQVDFLDVETGTHPLTYSNLPSDWQIMGDDRTGQTVTISDGEGPEIVYIGVYTGSSGSGGGSTTAGSSGGSSSGASSSATMTAMNISAMTCTTNDPDAIKTSLRELDGTCYWEIGAVFTVATQDGETLGSCTLEGDPFAGGFQIEPLSCTVPIPKGVAVVVTEDTSTITSGVAPEENPLTYTYPTDNQLVAAYMGVVFQNRPPEDN